jgi:hypothetical protein
MTRPRRENENPAPLAEAPGELENEKMSTKGSAEAQQLHSIEAGEPWARDAYPWLKYYAGEILKGTMDMENDEFGAFHRILIYYWQNGKLPADEDFCTVARFDKKTWQKKSEKILRSPKCIVHADNDSGLVAQRKARISESRSRVASGRKGGMRSAMKRRLAVPAAA